MSKPTDGSKYLANVKPRSSKKPGIMWGIVLGGTTASGWRSFKERKVEGNEES